VTSPDDINEVVEIRKNNVDIRKIHEIVKQMRSAWRD
jgi:hypothetical protein